MPFVKSRVNVRLGGEEIEGKKEYSGSVHEKEEEERLPLSS